MMQEAPYIRTNINQKSDDVLLSEFLSWFQRAFRNYACGGTIGAVLGLGLALTTGLPVWGSVSLWTGIGVLLVGIVYHFLGSLL